MINKLKYLTKFSLRKKIKTKWFVIANIIIFLIIAAIINIDLIIKAFGGDFDNKKEILVIDKANCYEQFVSTYQKTFEITEGDTTIIKKYEEEKESAYDEIKKEDKILLVIENDEDNFLKVEMVTNNNIDSMTYQTIITVLNNVKKEKALIHYGISNDILNKVDAPIEISRTKLEEKENTSEMTELIMGVVFPILILPFFMLTMFLVQMVGAEINEEKTTKGMEIIISNVSPQTHLLSKILAGNLFVLIQGGLLLFYGVGGVLIRLILSGNILSGGATLTSDMGVYINDIVANLELNGILNQLGFIIPITILLMISTLIAYSLVAAILASMTTNMEDYQQVQTPIIIISLIGYYLSIMASMFEGSIFIRILSYVPFISTLLSPALLILGQISIIDSLISLAIVIVVVYLLFKYGLRIYKVGILNYSSNNLWKKMFKAIKKKD